LRPPPPQRSFREIEFLGRRRLLPATPLAAVLCGGGDRSPSNEGERSVGPAAEELAVALDQGLALVVGKRSADLVALLAPHAGDGSRPEVAEARYETRMLRKMPLERRPDSCCIGVRHARDRERKP
jgi:hypothetical protein